MIDQTQGAGIKWHHSRREGGRNPFRRQPRHACVLFGVVAFSLAFAHGTQDVIANGDTRTLDLYHAHTRETLRVTFRRNGSFDSDALEKLNWFLRDWRKDEPTSMAPSLFDIVWYAYRESGASEPIKVVSAYRSPGTNEMLRRRSRAVAKDSHHTRGNAMDFHIPGISMAKVREIAMRLQRGGVGYYPTAGSPFVHLDVGAVRSWPRMTRDQLLRIFPDEKTVHLPADGTPLANYQVALAEVQARGGTALGFDVVTSTRGKSLWALLFGGDGDEDSVEEARSRVAGRNQRGRGTQSRVAATEVAALHSSGESVMRPTIIPVETVVAPTRSRSAVVPAPEPTVPVVVPPPAPKSDDKKLEVARPENLLQVASLPVPPIRPRGAQFDALVGAIEPLPPIRPSELKTVPPTALLAAAPVLVEPVEAEPAPKLVANVPLPPLRATAPTPLVEAIPVDPAPRLVARMPQPPLRPAIRPDQEAEVPLSASEPLPKLLAAAPQPPQRPTQNTSPARTEGALPAIVSARPPSGPALAPLTQAYAATPEPRPASPPRSIRPLAVRTTHDPAAKTDQRPLVTAQPAAEARPDYIVSVNEPPVAREINRAVVAMPLAKQSEPQARLGFGGSFIRPLGAAFTRVGE